MIKKLLFTLIVFSLSVFSKAQTDSSSVYSDSPSSENQIKKGTHSTKKKVPSNNTIISKKTINKPKYDKFGNLLSPTANSKQIPKQPSTPKNYLDYRRYQGRSTNTPKLGSASQKPNRTGVRNKYVNPNSKTTTRKYAAPVRLAKRAPKRIVVIDSLPPKEDTTTATTSAKNLNNLDSTYLKSALGISDTLTKKDSSVKRVLIITPEEMVFHKDSIKYYKITHVYGINHNALPAEEMKCLLITDPNASRDYTYFQKNAKPGLFLVSLGMLAGVVELIRFQDMNNQILNPYFITFSLSEIIGSRLLFKSDRHLRKSVSTFNKYVK